MLDKTAELIRAGKLREVSDMRDETDLGGLKLAIDLKRGTDPEKLMQKLYKMTPLMDSFSCQLQHPGGGQSARHGRGRDPDRVDGLAHGEHRPAGLFRA